MHDYANATIYDVDRGLMAHSLFSVSPMYDGFISSTCEVLMKVHVCFFMLNS